MLVLGRRKDEVITIGKDIEIMIVDAKPDGYVRIGITAPKGIPVHRKEVKDQIDKDNAMAALEKSAMPRE